MERMKILVTLKDLKEQTLRFMKQIGVDHVKIDVALIPEYKARGEIRPHDVRKVVELVESYGLTLDFFGYAPGLMLANILTGAITTDEVIRKITEVIECLSDAGVSMLEVDSEKTGYPIEMLELDMEIEADLGIDSITRVEILGTMMDRYPDLPDLYP